jgi:hypothetical protein
MRRSRLRSPLKRKRKKKKTRPSKSVARLDGISAFAGGEFVTLIKTHVAAHPASSAN